MMISEIMSDGVIALPPSAPVSEACRIMRDYGVGFTPIVDERGNALGVVTDRDIITRAAPGDMRRTAVHEIMTLRPVAISPDADVFTAVCLMQAAKIRRLVVCEEGVCGVLSVGDIARVRPVAASDVLDKVCQ